MSKPVPNLDRPTGDPGTGPTACPYGHPFGPRRMLVGWLPCSCTNARQRYGGHRTYQCLTCTKWHWTTIAYYPPHGAGDWINPGPLHGP